MKDPEPTIRKLEEKLLPGQRDVYEAFRQKRLSSATESKADRTAEGGV